MHIPVLKNEAIESLNIKKDGIYVDATSGRGGHASEILKKIPKGFLVCFDKDIEAINYCDSNLSKIGKNFKLIHSDFKNITCELNELGIKKVDGILADLGISSPQVDNGERGFSYNKDGTLDMRMDQRQSLNAHIVVNNYSKEDLIRIFHDYADEKFAKQIANAIIEKRPINSTLELVEIIRNSLPAFYVRKKNPAKSIFQAIRIEVNDEFNALRTFLQSSIELLNPGGKLAIITFHSKEDKIVKDFFGELTKNKLDPKIPINEDKKFSVKTINVTKDEINSNKRARSAKLRVITKIKE